MLAPVKLTPEGPEVSPIIAGVMTWGVWGRQLNATQMLELIEQAVELGITTFDHADIYGHFTTEATFGEALALKPALRKKIQLITKCGIKLVTPNRPTYKIKSYDTGVAHIIESVNRSLKNLQTDYIDLLLIHRPDPLMDPADIAKAFKWLRQDGKVRHFGVSNFTPSQFELVNNAFSLITNQVQANLLHRDPFVDGTFDQCMLKQIRPMAWSPLGGSQLFAKEPSEQIQRIREAAEPLQEKYGASFDQILTAWLLRHPAGIIPVLGTTRIERLKAAVEAQSIQLQREEWFMLWQAAAGEEVA
ncbi:MAG: aldo/keto reductase [Bacteroidota bacterium]